MSTGSLHADEVVADEELVDRLLGDQFPTWAGLPLVPVISPTGTDNVMFRLGDDMVVRLPRIADSAGQVDKEQRWLPVLAPQLPLEIPEPVAMGEPGEGYPWRWSVYRWLEGETATPERIDDASLAAADLGRFVGALQRIDPAGGPPPGDHNFWRGDDLAGRDADVRHAVDQLGDAVDPAALVAWEAALEAPVWEGEAMWVHGDLMAGNLLARGGRLTGVIDFGGLGVGDPACDVMAAWTWLEPGVRDAFREELTVDDATWDRGRGWALSVALIGLPYYETTLPAWAAVARHTIAAVLADTSG